MSKSLDGVLIKKAHQKEKFTDEQLREFASCTKPLSGPLYFLSNFFFIQHPIKGKMLYNPFDYQDGGWLNPFGDYKGYALQLVSELLGAVLTGSRVGIDPDRIPPSTNGVFMIAVNPEAFVGLDFLKKGVDEIIHYVKDIEPEPGKRIMIPGEPEWELKEKRLVEGIPIPTETWEEIKNLVNELGLDIEDYMSC